ncbi:PHB depolymerase family esterase [Longispora sp. K20-0274]|uniref:extracellular catalytic domain type 1 short-chain-length polyhydroxyalkanoate depolymerase n=1 Tax=Longispora sp. K20-0274 TaxID=3088255 RepID=UPI003999E010
MRWIAAPLLAVLVLAGCRAPADPGGIPVGSSERHVTVDGRDRTFQVYRPRALPAAAPLVVMLHGGFGSGRQAQSSYGWDPVADDQRFVVAYPDGLDRAWSVGGGCCGRPGDTGVDDVAFVRSVVAAVSARIAIDPARVYATGISNGGMLAYRLACDTTLFAAVAPDSATLLGPCRPPAPVSVLHIHGLADTNIPFGGGRGDGVAHIDGPPVPAVLDRWRAVDGCAPATEYTAGPVTRSTADCPGGRSVVLVTIAGAGHQWPGAAGKPVAEKLLGTDPPSTALDATREIWTFLAAHPGPPR